ncbi:MAG: gamma-glutamyltransferase family protein [Actinomycetota bacterium]
MAEPSAAAVSPHYLATAAAIEILAGGGNAVDAAVAANAVQGVVAPETCGIGGDLFALIHLPSEPAPLALNASGRAGAGADPHRLRAAGHRTMPPMDRQSVTVPGCVDGWEALLTRVGTMGWDDVLAPALRYADGGFPASEELNRALTIRAEALADQPIAAHLLPGGEIPGPGHQLRRPDLSRTLRDVADGGRSGFYEGFAGREITTATGGVITTSDLAQSQAEWVEPLSLEAFGLTGWTVPPNSQGYLTLAAAAVYAMVAGDMPIDDPPTWHLQIEAYRCQVADRGDVLADPDFLPVPAASLLGPDRIAAGAARVDPKRRMRYPPLASVPGGTAYMCVLDRSGVAVSLIQSNYMGLGTSICAGKAGFILQNRGAGFDLRPDHPNELAPGKRPLHTLSPTLWTQRGSLRALLGTRGGDYQPQLLLQMALRLFAAGLSPGSAQARPRWVIADLTNADAPVAVEASTPSSVRTHLIECGHQVVEMEGLQHGWGPVSVITCDPSGVVDAGADPRGGTAAAEVI